MAEKWCGWAASSTGKVQARWHVILVQVAQAQSKAKRGLSLAAPTVPNCPTAGMRQKDRHLRAVEYRKLPVLGHSVQHKTKQMLTCAPSAGPHHTGQPLAEQSIKLLYKFLIELLSWSCAKQFLKLEFSKRGFPAYKIRSMRLFILIHHLKLVLQFHLYSHSEKLGHASELSVNSSREPRSHRESAIAKYTSLLDRRNYFIIIMYH